MPDSHAGLPADVAPACRRADARGKRPDGEQQVKASGDKTATE